MKVQKDGLLHRRTRKKSQPQVPISAEHIAAIRAAYPTYASVDADPVSLFHRGSENCSHRIVSLPYVTAEGTTKTVDACICAATAAVHACGRWCTFTDGGICTFSGMVVGHPDMNAEESMRTSTIEGSYWAAVISSRNAAPRRNYVQMIYNAVYMFCFSAESFARIFVRFAVQREERRQLLGNVTSAIFNPANPRGRGRKRKETSSAVPVYAPGASREIPLEAVHHACTFARQRKPVFLPPIFTSTDDIDVCCRMLSTVVIHVLQFLKQQLGEDDFAYRNMKVSATVYVILSYLLTAEHRKVRPTDARLLYVYQLLDFTAAVMCPINDMAAHTPVSFKTCVRTLRRLFISHLPPQGDLAALAAILPASDLPIPSVNDLIHDFSAAGTDVFFSK